jgi:hypothetical protein
MKHVRLATPSWLEMDTQPSNNAFERPVKLFTSARVRRVPHFAPSARPKARRSVAQRER